MLLQGSKNKRIAKISKRNGVPFGESGQALIEYVLLLLITLLLLGGVIYQFNSAFRVFANSWFVGDESYIACAMKNGILPDGSDGEEVCTKPKFDITKGQTKNGQGIDANGQPLDQNRNTAAKNRGARGGSTAGGGGTRRAGDGVIGVIPFNSADAQNAGIATTAGSKAEGEKSYTGSSGTSSSGKFQDFEAGQDKGSTSRFRRGSKPVVDESTVQKQGQSVPLTIRDLKTAREIAAEKKKRAKAQEGSSFDLSFGNVFKYIIIALLVFSIVFFLGSQFLAVARSKKRK